MTIRADDSKRNGALGSSILFDHIKEPARSARGYTQLREEKKPAANRIHPTAKPVELVERALLNSSKAGDVPCKKRCPFDHAASISSRTLQM